MRSSGHIGLLASLGQWERFVCHAGFLLADMHYLLDNSSCAVLDLSLTHLLRNPVSLTISVLLGSAQILPGKKTS